MADYPRKGSSGRTLRSHGEQIRRIRTRIPPSSPVESPQDMTPYLEPGWSGANIWPFSGCPAFYKNGGRVYLSGIVIFDASAPGADPFQIATMPAGYRTDFPPDPLGSAPYNFTIHTYADATTPTTENLFWMVYIATNGSLLLETNVDPAVSSSGGYPIDDTWLVFGGEANYRGA